MQFQFSAKLRKIAGVWVCGDVGKGSLSQTGLGFGIEVFPQKTNSKHQISNKSKVFSNLVFKVGSYLGFGNLG